MLILTRRTGKKILINQGKIEVTIMYIGTEHASIGIKAPAHKEMHMRVFTLRLKEEILIDADQIKLKVLFIFNGHVAIGIQAPAHIDVDRKEIYLKKRKEKSQTAMVETVPE